MMHTDKKISCIVPVYNEARRVGSVLSVLLKHPWLDEVIVVNDGSTDDSYEVLRGIEGIELISYEKNQGKTKAMKLGFEATKNDLIMTIDSDLVGLNELAINDLIEPVRSGEAEVSLSIRKNSLGIYKLFGLDFVSGERVFSKTLFNDLSLLEKLPGFGLEVFMNQLIIQKGCKIKVVNWKNVISPRKSDKFGFFVGQFGDMKMIMEILRVLRVRGLFKQFRKMNQLRI